MKNKILMILLFFVIMAAIPLGFLLLFHPQNTSNPSSPQKIVPSNADEAAITAAMSLCSEDFDEETIKAITILQRTNKYAGEFEDGKTADNSDSELYKRVKDAYYSNKEILLYKNEPRALPCSKCSNGATEATEKYDYLRGVASPWDCLSADYESNAGCYGVSLNGLRYLCGQGLSAEEALLWYLPGFTIKTIE